jgi:FtsH-binding integral membrane protein
MAQQSPSSLKWFSALVGLTSLAIFVQAVTAGEFVSQKHRGGWIDAHDIVADVVAVLALATMIFTIVTMRKSSRALVVGTIVLFVLVVIQIFLGHQITDNKQDWLIGIHVPLAFIIFGIAIWLPINAVALRRAIAKSA